MQRMRVTTVQKTEQEYKRWADYPDGSKVKLLKDCQWIGVRRAYCQRYPHGTLSWEASATVPAGTVGTLCIIKGNETHPHLNGLYCLEFEDYPCAEGWHCLAGTGLSFAPEFYEVLGGN